MRIRDVESFLALIAEPDGSIDLSSLKKFAAGGTHDIYRSDQCPDYLLKVMKHSVGKEVAELTGHIVKLKEQYAALYEIFESSRCIIENRSIQLIKSSKSDKPSLPQQAIVSVVAFDTCFTSQDKFGFNVNPVELDGRTLESKEYLYKMANRSLVSNREKPSRYVMRNYPLISKNFDKLFYLLDTNESMVQAMKEFLTKYRRFYEKTGILLDTIGDDNVLFYKNNDAWQFKLGSVIKHDTAVLTRKMLAEIKENPDSKNQSFEFFTSIYFMPACIRAINVCAEKVGIPRIVDDVMIDDETIDALARMHLQLGKEHKILNCAEHNRFEEALELYQEFVPDESVDYSGLRSRLCIFYWEYIKGGGKENSRNELLAFLEILTDKRNKFDESKLPLVEEAIAGLQARLQLVYGDKSSAKNQASDKSTTFSGADIHAREGAEESTNTGLRGSRRK